MNARKTMIAINAIATSGQLFPCAAWGHVRRITWRGENTPKCAEDWKNKKPSDWGGATIAQKDYFVIFDGDGIGPTDQELAKLIHDIKSSRNEK
jgi:hypothetical protein